jgi:hypothetical protein
MSDISIFVTSIGEGPLHYFKMIIIYFRTNEEAAQIQKAPKITFKLGQFILRRKIIKLQNSIATGLSMPRALKERIDKDRGDIPRSRFILRILEKIYGNEQEQEGSPTTPDSHLIDKSKRAVKSYKRNDKKKQDNNIVKSVQVGGHVQTATTRTDGILESGYQPT